MGSRGAGGGRPFPAPLPGAARLTAAGQRSPQIFCGRLRPLGARRHLAVERRLFRAASPRPRPGYRRGPSLLHHRVCVGHGESPGPGLGDAPSGGEAGRK